MDVKETLNEAIEQVKEALRSMREGVVALVTNRNRLQDEVARLEQEITDLHDKEARAELLGSPGLSAEIKVERERRSATLEQMQALLAQAETQAEIAKINLPAEEARLVQQIQELKTRYVGALEATIRGDAPGGTASADASWDRAVGKVNDLQREASAREEVAGRPKTLPALPRPSLDQSAETMLADLERRMAGSASPPPPAVPAPAVVQDPAPAAGFLEIDDAPIAAGSSSSIVSIEPSKEIAPVPAAPAPPPESVAAPSGSTQPGLFQAGPSQAYSHPPRASQHPSRSGDRKQMEPDQRVRVAGIGTGGIFRGAHLPCYPEIPQAQLVALCDPDKKAQDLAYKRYQELIEARLKRAGEVNDLITIDRLERDLETVQICDDISEVIETIKPDLVDICTQPFLHTPLAIQALEAGIHVMCEKPVSRSWLESQRLIEAVGRTGKFYQHNENWLFDPEYYTVKKLVDSGAIGELVMMFLNQSHGGPEGNPRFWNPDFGGGGALLDNGIHAIGAAWFVTGLHRTPTQVKAAHPFGMSIRMPERIIDSRYQKITVDDDAHILIRFEDEKNGAWSTAHIEGSWSEQDSPGTVYIGTTGRIEIRQEENRRVAVVIDSFGNAGRKIGVSGPTWQHWPSSFYGEILNMVECVKNGVPSIMTAQFGADCSAIVGASYLSEKNGRRAVSLEEFRQFARSIAAQHPGDDKAADDALVNELLAAVRDK